MLLTFIALAALLSISPCASLLQFRRESHVSRELDRTAFAASQTHASLLEKGLEYSEDSFDVWVLKEPVARIPLKDLKKRSMQEEKEFLQGRSSTVKLDLKHMDSITEASSIASVADGASPFFASPKFAFTLAHWQSHDCTDVWNHTYVYHEGCSDWKQAPVGVLVVGTGRSGTDFLHEAMSNLGLDVVHDNAARRGRDGAVSWPHTFRPKSCDLPPWSYRIDQPFKKAFLLVRSPLKQMASRANNYNWPNNRYGSYYPQCMTAMNLGSGGDAVLHQVLQHWVLWNTFALTYVESVMRVEDVAEEPRLVAKLCEKMREEADTSLCSETRVKSVIEALGNQTNTGHTRKTANVTWVHLANLDRNFTAMAQQLAMKFGYEVPKDQVLPEVGRQLGCDWNSDGKWACSLH